MFDFVLTTLALAVIAFMGIMAIGAVLLPISMWMCYRDDMAQIDQRHQQKRLQEQQAFQQAIQQARQQGLD